MKAVAHNPYQRDAPHLFPKDSAIPSKFGRFPFAHNHKDEACDKQKGRGNQSIHKVENREPARGSYLRKHKSIDDMNLDHHEPGPTPQEIDENNTTMVHIIPFRSLPTSSQPSQMLQVPCRGPFSSTLPIFVPADGLLHAEPPETTVP